MNIFVQQFINFLQLGSIYALAALSFSMVYSIAGLVNFAHGSIFGISMYSLFFASTFLFQKIATIWPVFSESDASTWLVYIIVLIVASITTSLVAVLLERVAYHPLRNAPKVAVVVSSVGAGLAIEYLLLNFAGSKPLRMPALIPNIRFNILGTPVPLYKFMIIVIAILTLVVLNIVIKKTNLGTAMRAVSQDRIAAGFMGIGDRKSVV